MTQRYTKSEVIDKIVVLFSLAVALEIPADKLGVVLDVEQLEKLTLRQLVVIQQDVSLLVRRVILALEILVVPIE